MTRNRVKLPCGCQVRHCYASCIKQSHSKLGSTVLEGFPTYGLTCNDSTNGLTENQDEWVFWIAGAVSLLRSSRRLFQDEHMQRGRAINRDRSISLALEGKCGQRFPSVGQDKPADSGFLERSSARGLCRLTKRY